MRGQGPPTPLERGQGQAHALDQGSAGWVLGCCSFTLPSDQVRPVLTTARMDHPSYLPSSPARLLAADIRFAPALHLPSPPQLNLASCSLPK